MRIGRERKLPRRCRETPELLHRRGRRAIHVSSNFNGRNCAVRNHFIRIVVLTSCALSGGCALVDMKLPLAAYQPDSEPRLGTGRVEVAIPADPMFDKNKDGLPIIGEVRNGYGVHTADVVTPDSIPGWFANACQAEFAQAGYQTQVVPRLSPACQRGIQVEVQRFHGGMDPGFWTVGGVSDIEFLFTVVRDGQPVEQIRFKGMGDDRGMIGGGEEIRNGLKKAMQACLKQATIYASAAWRGV